jgi:acetyl-CoA/propionyl-CoA carboxylase biotin carboxyl carrier protein
MFGKVLIANRGEIAVRIIRTLRALGVASVAVYSDADADARHVREADEAIRIGPAAAAASYLNIDAIIDAARATGAQAVHPGYGFLAENPSFARAGAEAHLVFVGPPAAAIEAMGDKIAAKARVAAAGVPVVPGTGRPGQTDAELISEVDPDWFPVLIKPSAGGGGKGMHVARAGDELPAALAAARREARASFGDDTLLIETYVTTPRHIEIQVLADAHGSVIHLGERECSLQRRHQKIIEEAPSPLLDEARREAMGAAAAEAARSVGYTGAGTVEFIVSGREPDRFYFMEMNTRLQVEHPVTEMVYGLDLVEWQLRVAAGQHLPPRPPRRGHAVEARVYAEDPSRGFLPTGGTVLALREPDGPGVRVDSGLAPGTTVTSAYDPMLAKVIAWGEDRATALRRLDAALARTVILGVTTNVPFLRTLLRDPDVEAGRLDTGLVGRLIDGGAGVEAVPEETVAAAALHRLLARAPGPAGSPDGAAGPPGGAATAVDPWDIADGWRVGGPAWTRFRFGVAGSVAEVRVRGLASAAAEVAIGDGDPVSTAAELRPRAAVPAGGGADLLLRYGDGTVGYVYAADGETTWLGRDGHAWALAEEAAAPSRRGQRADTDAGVRSPMPGSVVAVQVSAGQAVTAGQPLLIVEAMKMEHTVTAPVDGVITELLAKTGQQVRMDQVLAVIGEAAGDGGGEGR